MTDSMRRAIDETGRRRTRQMAFNEAHGIVPKGLNKAVRELIDGVVSPASVSTDAALEIDMHLIGDDKRLAKEIRRLEKQMQAHARNLEFEQAANVRDALQRLKESAVMLG